MASELAAENFTDELFANLCLNGVESTACQKLDKFFIPKIANHNDTNSIIRVVINVARGMYIDFIAEGVETVQQHE